MPEVDHETRLHQKIRSCVIAKFQTAVPLQVVPLTLAPRLGRGTRGRRRGDVSRDARFDAEIVKRRSTHRDRRGAVLVREKPRTLPPSSSAKSPEPSPPTFVLSRPPSAAEMARITG